MTGVTYDISKKKIKKKVKKKKKNPILTGGASGGAKPLTGGAFAPPCPPLVPPLSILTSGGVVRLLRPVDSNQGPLG